MPRARSVRMALAVAVLGVVISGSSLHRPPREPQEPVIVGIIDTGIDRSLRLAVDEDRSISLVPGDPTLDDLDGHGTEMAGIVHRAAPDARLVAVKALDASNSTSDDLIAAGIDHLRDVGASIVLVSLAGAEPLPRTYRAIERAGHRGVTVYAAAGNDGLDLDRAASYPGGYRLANLVTVAATDGQGRILGTSNRGGAVSRQALGAVATCARPGRPVIAGGTSAAAALVAGRAARRDGRTQLEPVDCERG